MSDITSNARKVWGAAPAVEDFELPSGLTISVRTTVNPWTLIEAGLLNEAAMNGSVTISEYTDFLAKVISKVLVVEPKLGTTEEAEENSDIIPMANIPTDDFKALTDKAGAFFQNEAVGDDEEAANATTFPDESGSDGDSADVSVLGDDASSGTGDSAGNDGVAESKPSTRSKAKSRRSRAKSDSE